MRARQMFLLLSLLTSLPQPLFSLPTDGRITSFYGWRRSPTGGEYQFHHGLDIAAFTGMKVRAVAEGKVVRVAAVPGYGLLIDVAHTAGFVSRYAHLSQALVVRGSQVTRRQLIGLMGASGRATASHLHFEMLHDGIAIDPLNVLAVVSVPKKNDARPREIGYAPLRK